MERATVRQRRRPRNSAWSKYTSEASAAIFAGWLYHFWNGFNFAIIYALVAGPRRWYWGVAWAMMLEIGMLLSYPTFLKRLED